MFKILLSSIIVTSLYAVSINVKKADVVLSINSQELTLSKGKKMELEEGSTICYMQGKGKVVIPALKKQLKKVGRCVVIPMSESTVTAYANSLKNMATIAFWDSSESVRHGAGTKGEVEFDGTNSIQLAKNQKELIIYGKSFGPLPVLILLKDTNGNEVLSYENEDSETTLFRVDRHYISNGMRLEIYNGFEELLVSKNIVKEL